MNNVNLKLLVFWVVPLFCLDVYLLVNFNIPGLAFCGILAFIFLVPPFFSRDVEEVSIKGVTLVRRFRKNYDKQLQEHTENFLYKSLATVDDKIAQCVARHVGGQDAAILELTDKIEMLANQDSGRSTLPFPIGRIVQCPKCCSADLCRDHTGVYCNRCCEYICYHQSSAG